MTTIFKKTNENSTADFKTIIGKSIKIKGDFKGEDNILIEGEVDGKLSTNNQIDVAEGAKVKAEIEAGDIHIAGTVEGNIICKGSTEITATGKIIGNISTKTIAVAAGADVKGQCSTFNSESDLKIKKDNKVL